MHAGTSPSFHHGSVYAAGSKPSSVRSLLRCPLLLGIAIIAVWLPSGIAAMTETPPSTRLELNDTIRIRIRIGAAMGKSMSATSPWDSDLALPLWAIIVICCVGGILCGAVVTLGVVCCCLHCSCCLYAKWASSNDGNSALERSRNVDSARKEDTANAVLVTVHPSARHHESWRSSTSFSPLADGNGSPVSRRDAERNPLGPDASRQALAAWVDSCETGGGSTGMAANASAEAAALPPSRGAVEKGGADATASFMRVFSFAASMSPSPTASVLSRESQRKESVRYHRSRGYSAEQAERLHMLRHRESSAREFGAFLDCDDAGLLDED